MLIYYNHHDHDINIDNHHDHHDTNNHDHHEANNRGHHDKKPSWSAEPAGGGRGSGSGGVEHVDGHQGSGEEVISTLLCNIFRLSGL